MPDLDKFNTWLRAVAADPVLTGTDKFVLAYIAVFYVRSGEDTFCVRQSTVAEKCAVSRKAVNGAIGRARRAGFLAVSRIRQRGNGHHGADELRLTVPELSNQELHHFSEGSTAESAESCNERLHHLPESDVTVSPELCNQTAQSDVTVSPELCNRTNTSTSGNNTPTGFKTGIYTGLSAGTAAAAAHTTLDVIYDAEIVDDTPENPEPPLYCPKHMPDGTTDNCGNCMRLRLARKARQQERLNRNLEEIQRRSAETSSAVTACNLCDEKGWLLGPDGGVADPAIWCDHAVSPRGRPSVSPRGAIR